MRAARLLSLVLLLQNRGRLTAGELAAELGVSVRTVYRDIDSLSGAGIPVYGEAGQGGGYQLLGGYRPRLTGRHADRRRQHHLRLGPRLVTGVERRSRSAGTRSLISAEPAGKNRALTTAGLRWAL